MVNNLLKNYRPFEYPSGSVKLLERLNKSPSPENDKVDEVAQSPVLLSIVVVGAGLGGLATAVALARRGHKVTVLEQAPQLTEVGAGIQVPPNSGRLLLSWGLGPYLAGRVVQPEGMTFRRWKDGKAIAHTRLVPEFSETFGAAYFVVHRADLHTALCRLACDLGVKTLTDSKVVHYNEDSASVRVEDGREFSGDLVVAADGVKSSARPVVLGGEDLPPWQTGFAVYRAVVDTELLRGDPDTEWLLEKPSLNVWIGEDRHVMTYCIAGGNTFNMVLSHVDHSDPNTWGTHNTIEEMRACFEGWDPRLTKIIHMIKHTTKWALLNGATLPTWISPSKKLLILGDAAHAMVPYMSQGAAMAVEDGAALAQALHLISTAEEVPHALKIFENERMRRSGGMQTASLVNGRLWHLADGPEQEARDRGSAAEVEGRHFLESTNQWSDPTTQMWAYGYDAEEAVRRAWGDGACCE